MVPRRGRRTSHISLQLLISGSKYKSGPGMNKNDPGLSLDFLLAD